MRGGTGDISLLPPDMDMILRNRTPPSPEADWQPIGYSPLSLGTDRASSASSARPRFFMYPGTFMLTSGQTAQERVLSLANLEERLLDVLVAAHVHAGTL